MMLICEQALKIIDDKEIKQWLSSIIRYGSVLAFTKKIYRFFGRFMDKFYTFS